MVILLIISPYLPAQTPNTLRWEPILRMFKKNNHKLHVLTSNWSGNPQSNNSELAHIHRAGHHTLMDAVSNLTGISQHRRNMPDAPVPGTRIGFIRGLAEWLADKLWRPFYWPDGSTLFLKPGKKLADELIHKLDITHVISVGLPFTCHLIGHHIKKKRPDIFWLMDIEDVFSYSDRFRVNNLKLYRKKNIKAEERCFQMADRIVLTNETARDRYIDLFQNFEYKMTVIPPLFERPERCDITEPEHQPDGNLHLAYFGSFYEGIRSPEPFLKLLSLMVENNNGESFDLVFHFFGEQTPYSQKIFQKFPSLNDCIIQEGFLDRRRLYKALNGMDILLNFSNDTDYHTPSKLVEFLYFQKPVVNIASHESNSSRAFLNGRVELLNLVLGKNTMTVSAKAFNDFVRKKRPMSMPDIKNVEAYLSSEIADAYLKLMDD